MTAVDETIRRDTGGVLDQPVQGAVSRALHRRIVPLMALYSAPPGAYVVSRFLISRMMRYVTGMRSTSTATL